MKTSVIIPTYNGAHKIVGLLNSLEEQRHIPDEIIVVIDGSTDGTVDVIKNVELKVNSLKIIEQSNKGRAAVRNRGAIEAVGELLIFIDDDMIASENCLASHVHHHSIFKDTLLVGRSENYGNVDINDFYEFRMWLHYKWSNFTTIPSIHEPSKLLLKTYLNACNFSINKKLFFELGGFDERLNDAEDYDLAVHAMQKGYSIYWNRDALAYNNDIDNSTCKKFILRQRQYAEARNLLIQLKPETYNGVIASPEYKPDILRAFIFKLLCSIWWINSADNRYWIWLPKQIRFKLYDMIITANSVLFPEKVKLS
jgi:glycosyltransferase involved in cell wall biosynthesis